VRARSRVSAHRASTIASGRKHSYLKELGRPEYAPVTVPGGALDACSGSATRRHHPALETAHAFGSDGSESSLMSDSWVRRGHWRVG